MKKGVDESDKIITKEELKVCQLLESRGLVALSASGSKKILETCMKSYLWRAKLERARMSGWRWWRTATRGQGGDQQLAAVLAVHQEDRPLHLLQQHLRAHADQENCLAGPYMTAKGEQRPVARAPTWMVDVSNMVDLLTIVNLQLGAHISIFVVATETKIVEDMDD